MTAGPQESMQDKLAVTTSRQGQVPPLLLTPEPPRSAGRPYSSYPYRDLPKTPSEWEARAQYPRTQPAPTVFKGDFRLFSYLPAELRLQIWRQAVLSACSHGRVHRVGLAITVSSPNNSFNLELLPTPELIISTHSTRSLLSTCSEARHECLSLLPDTLPLRSSVTGSPSILRCALAQDILTLDNLSTDLLLQLDDLLHHDLHRGPALIGPVRHLGLDLGQLLRESESSQSLYPGTAVSPAVETALVSLLGRFERVEGVYLLPGAAAAVVGGSSTLADLGGNTNDIAPAPPPSVLSPPQGGHVFLGLDGRGPAGEGTEWYTTQPFASYYVGEGYYPRLKQAMRFLCQLRQAMDAPAVVTDLDEELLERLEGVKVRFLGHYVVKQRAGVGLDEEGLKLSSPERCLESGLGEEPRWVQWEWVCQCLDC